MQDTKLNENEVWILLLAAGFSRRMGQQKLLLPFKEETIVRYIAKKVLNTKADGVFAVTNSEFPNVTKELVGLPMTILENNNSVVGMSSSLRMGIKYAKENDLGAVIIVLADQPGIDPSTIDMIVEAYKEKKSPIIQANYVDGPSHPVLFSNSFFNELLQINGDQGAKNVLKENGEQIQLVSINARQPNDIDTKEDYVNILANDHNY